MSPGPSSPSTALSWDVFCRVIDNHGDVGVCWRLSADLGARGHRVRLWIDDASALAWMAPDGARGVEVLPWRDPWADEQPGDVVVEAFGCDPPAAFVERMAALPRQPLWINLEYLSAESYVERSHGLRSPQMAGPGRGLDKWFFYPGFTAATGGLLREPGVSPPDIAPMTGRALNVTLFSYDPPGLMALRDALESLPYGARVDVTPGWSARSVAARLGDASAGRVTWRHLAHVPQPAFDAQLRGSDLNLVRGEDSLVRALWAGRPFVWQLYPQDDGAHADKLEAFLSFYLDGASPDLADTLGRVWRNWNGLAGPVSGDPSTDMAWRRLLPAGPLWAPWQAWSSGRANALAAQPDLLARLLDFVSRQGVGGQSV
ncbi:elongation factor P maturation arginine rhamnosyltransferase EarP [Leptothrix sp. BB-4]